MKVLLDASSLINLHRGRLLEIVLGLTSFGFVFYIGNIVRDECGDLQELLDLQSTNGTLIVLPANTMTPEEFTGVLNLYDLGLGETECIALANRLGLCVCTDDKAARRAAVKHIGDDRVLGSLRLVRECVRQGLLDRENAILAYEAMKAGGAFLPTIAASYFES